MHTYIQLNRTTVWGEGIDFTETARARARLLAEFEGWAPQLTALITEADTGFVARKIHALPDAHPGDAEQALAVYEQELFARSAAEAADSHQILELCLGERAPHSLVEFLTGASAQDANA